MRGGRQRGHRSGSNKRAQRRMNRVNASMPLREQAWAVSECAGFVFGLGAFASRAAEIHRGGGYLNRGAAFISHPRRRRCRWATTDGRLGEHRWLTDIHECAENAGEQESGAVERNRTFTGCPTATSTLRVYQFRHDREIHSCPGAGSPTNARWRLEAMPERL